MGEQCCHLDAITYVSDYIFERKLKGTAAEPSKYEITRQRGMKFRTLPQARRNSFITRLLLANLHVLNEMPNSRLDHSASWLKTSSAFLRENNQ
jgi:hypothetical protein